MQLIVAFAVMVPAMHQKRHNVTVLLTVELHQALKVFATTELIMIVMV